MRKIDPSRQADKFLRRLPPKHARQLATKISQLAVDPQPPDAKQLRGLPYWRADSGEYRIIYTFDATTCFFTLSVSVTTMKYTARCSGAADQVRWPAFAARQMRNAALQ